MTCLLCVYVCMFVGWKHHQQILLQRFIHTSHIHINIQIKGTLRIGHLHYKSQEESTRQIIIKR